jgi:membrane protease YdiL (CAAX protease family)
VVTGLLGHPTPKVGHETLKALIATDSQASLALMLLSAAVIAPVLEELVFRGMVQTTLLAAWGELRPLGRARAVVVFFASLMFAAVHVGVVAPHTLPALFALSLILGWVYERTGRLWPCVLIHAGFNTVNLAWALAMRSGAA